MRVALLDKDEDGLSETSRIMKVTNPRARSFVIPCDVRSEQEVRVSMDCVVEEWGRIDYAVNCAGILGRMAPSHLLSPTDFDLVNSINYRGVWLSAREELKRMLRQVPLPTHDGRPGNRGTIVNVAGHLGLVSAQRLRKSNPFHAPSENRGRCAFLELTWV